MNTQPELFALDKLLDRSNDSDSSDGDSLCCSTVSLTSLEGEEFDSLDECLEAYSLAEYIQSQHNKNKLLQVDDYVDQDMRPLAFVCFNTSLGKPKLVTIKALLDSGASESLISKKYVLKLRVKSSKKKGTVWSTPGGDLHTTSLKRVTTSCQKFTVLFYYRTLGQSLVKLFLELHREFESGSTLACSFSTTGRVDCCMTSHSQSHCGDRGSMFTRLVSM
jgi:Aspartyl protease